MPEGPTVQKRRLALEMKRCRERSGLTQEEVARHFEWNAAKVTRMETARTGIPPRDVRDLLELYGVDDEDYRESLLVLSRNAKSKTWYTQYRDIIRCDVVSLEAEADAVRYWEPMLVPGMFQTEEYARALLSVGLPPNDRDNLDKHVALRMDRQKRLTNGQPFQVSAVIDESALHRVVGGMDVMERQFDRVIELAKLDHILVQVLPYDAGAHALMNGPVTLLEFPELSDLDAVCIESIAIDQAIQEPSAVKYYRRELEKLQANALSPEATLELLAKGVRHP